MDTNKLKEDYAKLFSPALLKDLEEVGHDFIESKREGAYIFDTNNNKYLDCLTSRGIYNLGRKQEELAEELKIATPETDQGNFPMISIEKSALAKSLANFTPGNLECSVFSVVRGETIEFACKVARGYTKRTELVTVDGGWYGQTGFALTLSERDDKDQFAPLIPDTKTIPFNDISSAKSTISENTAAVILEPIQAENNCRMADNSYLEGLRAICDECGALLVFDETQSGFGRTGWKFAFDYAGVTPDILVVGEALGAGIFPIAATIITQEVNSYMNAHPMIHLSTFGGSDLGCRVGKKSLEIYERERPWENAKAIGRKLVTGLENIRNRKAGKILSISGQGLLVSIELQDENTAKAFCKKMTENGVLISNGSVAKNSIVYRPPLTITENEMELILKATEKSL